MLLTIDSVVNLGLGALLVIFPRRLMSLLGIPEVESAFYPSLLGGVLIGVGIAQWIERGNRRNAARGLGLSGAITINLTAGVVLAVWLLLGNLALPPRGLVLLWGLVVILVGLSLAELTSERRSDGGR
jgi:hypothetical protein